MKKSLFLHMTVRQTDAITGVLPGLGALAVEISYLVFAILVGMKLFRQGAYYQLFKQAGEEKRTDSQTANVIGSIIYIALIFILLPLVKAISKRLFGG